MRIKIISVGRVREKYIIAGENEYLKRIDKSIRIETKELGLSFSESMAVSEQLKREATELNKVLKPIKYIIALDSTGDMMTSEQFAGLLEGWMNKGASPVSFIIGSANGLEVSVKENAQKIMSLSPMTFPHQLTRLILIEQIYRAHTLIQGSGYHK